MGKALCLNYFFGANYVLYLRIINALMALLYLFVFYRLAEEVLKSRLSVGFALVVHSSVLMFSYLFASVNNDNLVNLLSVVALYTFVKVVRERTTEALYLFLICIFLGMLTKQTFWPLALCLGCLLCVDFRFKVVDILKSLNPKKAPNRVVATVALLFVVALLSANVSLHGYNYCRYGKLAPRATDLYSHEQSMRQHDVYAKYNQLREELKSQRAECLWDPFRFFFVWSDYMIEKCIGIFAYRSYYPGKYVLGLFECFIIFAIWYAFRKGLCKDRLLVYLLVLAAVHIAVLAFWVNYRSVLNTGLMPRYAFIGIQGRYVFPVLAPLILLFARSLGGFRSAMVNLMIALIVGGCITIFSFPLFLMKPKEERFVPNAALQAEYLKNLELSQRFKGN